MPKISIIVPVYNTEKYLRRCLDSILAQTFKDFELLLINDGSIDNSGAICDEYVLKDSRIRVFHKENGGVSSARNLGLEKCTGEWIGWVDSDDYIDSSMYFNLYNAVVQEEAEIAYCDYIDIDENQKKKIKLPDCDNGSIEFINKYFQSPISALWVTLVKTSLYKENNFIFPTENYFGEDFLLTAKLYLCSKKNIHVSKYLYTHCYRLGESLMGSYSYSKCMMMLENLKEFHFFIKKRDFYPQIKKNLASKIIEAKRFLLYQEKDVMKWYYTETWTHKYILNCVSPLYGRKRKLIEFGIIMCCNVIHKLLGIRL